MALFVNYGCGLQAPDSWINFDASPRLRAERLPVVGAALRKTGKTLFPANARYGDIVKGLPVADGSADAVFSSHTLEHIDRHNVERALANTLRIMKSGAVFRLVVPDLGWRASRFVEDSRNAVPGAADAFMHSSMLGEARGTNGVAERLRSLIGNSQHRWMYDYAAMESLLQKAGFVAIRRAHFGDSEIASFGDVEHPDRFVDEGHPELAIQASKA